MESICNNCKLSTSPVLLTPLELLSAMSSAEIVIRINFSNATRVSNSTDSDQIQRFVGLDLGSNSQQNQQTKNAATSGKEFLTPLEILIVWRRVNFRVIKI